MNNKPEGVKRILITGAGGLTGQSFVERFLKEGYQVTAIYNSGKPQKDFAKEAAWIKCNLQKEQIEGINADELYAIIHCAALIPTDVINDELCYNANRAIDNNVFGFCAKSTRVNIIFLSSIYIENYEPEELETKSRYLYGKRESEEQLMQMKNKSASFRISSPYGPRQANNNVFKIFMKRAIAGDDLLLHGSGNRTQDFISADDIAAAGSCFLKTKAEKGIYNICSGNAVSMRKLAELIQKASSKKFNIRYSGQPDIQEEYRASFDNTVSANKLGWQPEISLAAGIEKWFKYSEK